MSFQAGSLYYQTGGSEFYFPPAISSTVRQRPVEDSTGRYTKYEKFSLLIEFLVYAGCDVDPSGTRLKPSPLVGPYTPLFPNGTTTDAGATTLRKILGSSGGVLFYKDKGIGADFMFSGNRQQSADTKIDVLYGPKPRLIVWEPIAGNRALRVIWEVEVTFADCTIFNNVAEFKYETNWSVDHCGLTTRSVSGEIEIAVMRQDLRVLDNADKYRQFIDIRTIPGFTRKQDYKLSSDRKRLTFNIVDSEIDSDEPYYPGICECKVDERVSNRSVKGKSLVTQGVWQVDLSGTIRVAAGYPKWYAWLAFFEILKSRMGCGIQISKEQPYADAQTMLKLQKEAKQKDVIWTKLSITEQIYGREMNFSASWYYFESGMNNIFVRSCMWKKIGNNNTWAKHNESMLQSVGERGRIGPWSHRGTAQLYHDTEQDLIVSMCSTPDRYGNFVVPNNPNIVPPPSQLNPSGQGTDTTFGTIFGVEINANLVQQSNNVSQQLLGGASPEEQNIGTGINSSSGAIISSVVQQRAASNYKVEYSGVGMRMGKPMPRVHLKTYGGRKATQIGSYEMHNKKVRTVDGKILWMSRWHAMYQLDGPPANTEHHPSSESYN